MKKTIILALTFLSLSAQAWVWGPNRGDGYDRGRGGWGEDRGRGGWDDRGRADDSTYRWEDAGTYKLPKAMEQEIVVDVRGAYLNEIALRAQGRVQITSAYAELSDRRMIDLRVTGTVTEGREVRAYLDRYAVRVERVIIRGTSPDLIGSRGQVQVLLGLAR
jgi:hypothetical protein